MARIYQDNFDTFSISESLANGENLRVSDEISILESEAKAIANNGLGDSLTISEALANSASTRISDSITFGEDIDHFAEFYREKSDELGGIAEAVQKAIKPGIEDSASFSETITRIIHYIDGSGNAFLHNLFDMQVFAEEISKNASLGKTDSLSIAEAIVKAVGAGLTTGFEISEEKVFNFIKAITDSVSFADASLAYDVSEEAWWGMIKWRSACHGAL
jgi:hypothetical protein